MEQDTSTTMPVANSDKQKSGKGLKIATAIACIVAVCGIGFGVYGMLQSSQKDTQIADLNTQVKDKNDTIAKIETPKTEANTNGETPAVATDTVKVSGGPYIEDDYFYVPEWGLKFHIPSDLANYGYSVDYDSAHVGYTLPGIGFTAMLKSSEAQGMQRAYYDDIQTCSIVNVFKEAGTWPSDHMINGLVKQFDDYALLIWNYSSHEGCDYNYHIDEVQEKIQTMFSNPEAI